MTTLELFNNTINGQGDALEYIRAMNTLRTITGRIFGLSDKETYRAANIYNDTVFNITKGINKNA